MQTQVEKKQYISPIWITNGSSSTVIIPIDIARKFEMDRPCHVLFEEREDGILIKKLKIQHD